MATKKTSKTVPAKKTAAPAKKPAAKPAAKSAVVALSERDQQLKLITAAYVPKEMEPGVDYYDTANGMEVETDTPPYEDSWKLLPKHEARIPEWDKKWTEIITSVKPMDEVERQIVTGALHNMYLMDGMDRPKVTFVSSPLAAALVAGAGIVFWEPLEEKWDAKAADKARANAFSETARAKRAEVTKGDPVREAVYDHALASVLDITADHPKILPNEKPVLSVSYLDDLFDILSAATAAIFDDPEESHRKIQTAYQTRNGGNQWCSWVAYLDFVREVIGWKHKSHTGWRDYYLAGVHSGPRYMAVPFNVVADRPYVEHIPLVNNTYQPHCTDGPAMAWADGFALWYIDGVALDSQAVMAPETQTLEQLNNEQSGDAQAIRIDRYGWDRYIAESGAKELDRRYNASTGTMEALYDVSTRNGGRRLVATCNTGRIVTMGVPSDTATCEAAQAYLQANNGFNIIGAT